MLSCDAYFECSIGYIYKLQKIKQLSCLARQYLIWHLRLPSSGIKFTQCYMYQTGFIRLGFRLILFSTRGGGHHEVIIIGIEYVWCCKMAIPIVTTMIPRFLKVSCSPVEINFGFISTFNVWTLTYHKRFDQKFSWQVVYVKSSFLKPLLQWDLSKVFSNRREI